jgi:hypothetical protein
MVTGHGKLKSYYHRLHIIEDPGCTCIQGDQTVAHLLMHCTKLDQQRNVLRTSIIKKDGIWPPLKHEFMSKHLKEFCKFVNSIDFENIGQ